MLKLLNDCNPKNIHVYIKSDRELYNEIQKCYGGTLAEKAYNFLYEPDVICPNGNTKKFDTLKSGYKFCGRAGTCVCAKAQVSAAVSNAKRNTTPEEKAAINAKRDATNMQKYGVSNIGQTSKARMAHAEFYADKKNVDDATKKSKQTRLEKYGDENYCNAEQARVTFAEKYPPEYWALRCNNPGILDVNDRDLMLAMAQRMTYGQMAERIGVHVGTIQRYIKRYKNELGIDW